MNNATDNNANVSAVFSDYDNALGVLQIPGGWIGLSCALLQMLLFILIVWKERRTTAKNNRASKIFNKVNILLVALILSNGLNLIFIYLGDITWDVITYSLFYSVGTSFQSLFCFLVLEYTWTRSVPIVTLMWKKGKSLSMTVRGLYFLLQLTFAIFNFFNNLGPPSMQTFFLTAMSYVQISSEILAFIFDCALLFLFLLYLQRVRSEGSGQDTERLAIIARYGIFSFFVYQLWMASNATFNAWYGDPDNPVPVLFFSIMYDINQYLPVLYIFIQIFMKWTIYVARENVKKSSGLHTVASLETGKLMSKTSSVMKGSRSQSETVASKGQKALPG